MPLKPVAAGLVVLLTALLTGCAGIGGQPSEPPLPALATLECCWQSQQQVTVFGPEQDLQLLAVIERQPQQLTLVMLDNLGRRLLTLNYSKGQLTTRDPDANLPPRLQRTLVAAVFLHHATPGPWVTGTDWQVVATGQHKDLRVRGQSFVTLTYLDSHHQERLVTLTGHPLRVKVKPLGTTTL